MSTRIASDALSCARGPFNGHRVSVSSSGGRGIELLRNRIDSRVSFGGRPRRKASIPVPPLDLESSVELLVRVRAGDREALEQLLKRDVSAESLTAATVSRDISSSVGNFVNLAS